MKINQWTAGLAAAGLVSLASVASAEETQHQVLTALSSTTLSGYIDTSAIWKFGTGDAAMPGRVYDTGAAQDGFNMNVVSLTLEKPLDEGEWSAGYRVQMLFGPYANLRGTGILGSADDFAFNEAVVLLRVPVGNGIDFKVGQFGTYNGYEAFDTYKNPNWSRSYGFYVESSAHTGISASYQINDIITVMAGVGNIAGFNNQVDARAYTESRKAYLGMITLTAPESLGFLQGATLSLGYTGGDALERSNPLSVGSWRQENLYAGLALPTPIEGLAVGLAYDYTAGINFRSSYANATALYVTYKATEKLSINNRFDYATGSNGTFGYTSATENNELFAYTLTVDYSLWANVVSRVEFRWDHALTDDKPFGGNATSDGDENALSLALNIIYKF